MDDKTSYWLELAQYDLETARAMLETGRYLYVGFMCHQVVEKALKAVVVSSTGKTPPYIHDLRKLAELSCLYEKFDDNQKDFIDNLEPLNIRAHPDEMHRILRALNADSCRELLEQADKLYGWIEAAL